MDSLLLVWLIPDTPLMVGITQGHMARGLVTESIPVLRDPMGIGRDPLLHPLILIRTMLFTTKHITSLLTIGHNSGFLEQKEKVRPNLLHHLHQNKITKGSHLQIPHQD